MSAVSRLEHKIQALSLVAALLTIPAIFLQSSNSHTLHYWGDLISIAIWLFFVVEAMILLRITPNNWDWLRQHKLEAFIVVGASPIFTLMGEREMVFGVVPLLIIPRVLKLLKFAKIIKIGKLLKSVKIVKKVKTFQVGSSLLFKSLRHSSSLEFLGQSSTRSQNQ